MKQSELTKLVGEKLSEEEKAKLLDAINSDTNSIVSKRDETIDTLKKENDTLKASADVYAKDKEALTTQLQKANTTVDVLNKKSYIYKNINNSLADDDVEDLLTLTNARMAQNKDAKFEDVVTEVAKKRQFGGLDSKQQAAMDFLAPAPKVSSSFANNDGGADKLSAQDTMSWLGFNKKK